jgi:hypothetical protein
MTRGWTLSQWKAFLGKAPEPDLPTPDHAWAYQRARWEWMVKRDLWGNDPLTTADFKAGRHLR